MFEQASIESPGLLKRPLAMTISLAGQAAAVSAVALVSLLHLDSLPKPTFFAAVPAPVRPMPIPAGAGVPAAARPARQALIVFSAPASIPAGIHPTGPESMLLTPVDVAPGSGVPGGVDGFSGAGSGLLESIGRLPPQIPAPAPEKPGPPAARPTQVHVGSGVQAAKLIRQVTPIYPALARQARVAGTVRLTAIISREGAIRNLQVISGHSLLTAAALDAVKQWLYQPTLLNEEPVEVITQIDVNFTLSR